MKLLMFWSENKVTMNSPSLPFVPESDQHLISPYIIIPESFIRVTRIKEIITRLKKLLIVKQILLASTLGNV